MKALASRQTHPLSHMGICKEAIGLLFLVLIISSVTRPTAAYAQEFRATISGLVVDPSGAVVPGAGITVKETNTGTTSQTKSDSVGQYVMPFLLPGAYTVTVTKPGFETLTRSGIVLQAQDHPIVNLILTVGSETQTVKVTTETPLLDVANASVGSSITIESVTNLPLNGRAPEMLAELAPGVMMSQAPQSRNAAPDDSGINSWVIGGTPTGATETLLDGAPNESLAGGLGYSPTEDTVQEVSVKTFDSDASYGHTLSGTVNQITKGGTNRIHGTGYMFRQMQSLDANLYFNGRLNPVPASPPQNSNLYGLSVGGPVWIPKLFDGRNKVFFFFAFERNPSLVPGSAIFTVPTDAEKQGDFSALLAGGPTYQLYEPGTGTIVNGTFTRTPVPNNCLTNKSSYCSTVANAGITIDPIAAAYLKLFPEPNITAGVSPITNVNNYSGNANVISGYNNEFGRLDYNISTRDHMFFAFHNGAQTQSKINYFNNNSTGSLLNRQAYGTLLDNVFTFNPSTVFDVRLNATIILETHTPPSLAYPPTSVGFPSYLQSSGTPAPLPIITTTGFNAPGYQTFGDAPATTSDPTLSYQIFGDVIKSIGNHTLKVGVDARQYRFRTTANPYASFTFGSNFVTSGSSGSAQPFGGDLASFEYGLPTSGFYGAQALNDYRAYYFAGFVQDDWRVSSNFTLNLGLRYDLNTPFGEKFGRTVNGFNPNAVNSASGAANVFMPTTLSKNDTTVTVSSINALGGLTFPSQNWGAPYQIRDNAGLLSPRIGFSYNPFTKTVVRGGFALFVQPQNLGNSSNTNNQEGFTATTNYSATTNNYFTSAGTLDNPFPNGFASATGSSAGASTYLGEAISFLAPVEHDQYSERWTLSMQHQLTGSTLLEAIYEGNHALFLPVTNNINATELQYLTTNPYRDQNLATIVGTAVTNPFAGLVPLGSSYNGATTALSNLLVPYPQFGSAAINEQNQTIGQSYFEGVIAHVEHRTAHGLTLTANYEFSKEIEADTYLNPQVLTLERRISPNDHKHHFVVGGTYDLPFGRGKLLNFGGNRLVDEIAGGWVVNGILQFQTGSPITFTGDIPLQPGVTLGDIKSSPRDRSTTTPALSTSAFVTGSTSTCTVAAGQACDGTAFFNGQYVNHLRTLPTTISSVRQDGFNNVDASLIKNFNVSRDRSAYVQFRFETFNTFNHPIFGTPSLTPTSTGFGYITSVFSSSTPRQVQIGIRGVF